MNKVTKIRFIMEGPQIKVYSSRKHPNDMKYGKRPRRRPGYCFCGNPYCSEGVVEKIPTSGKTGSRKKTKGLGLKEQKEKEFYDSIEINHEIISRDEED